MSDKMREEFETWYIAENFGGDRECAAEWMAREDGGDYLYAAPFMAWNTWKVSRAALVVELPASEYMDDGHDEYGYVCRTECFHSDELREALTKAGVTVK